jgi:hypothetical protein
MPARTRAPSTPISSVRFRLRPRSAGGTSVESLRRDLIPCSTEAASSALEPVSIRVDSSLHALCFSTMEEPSTATGHQTSATQVYTNMSGISRSYNRDSAVSPSGPRGPCRERQSALRTEQKAICRRPVLLLLAPSGPMYRPAQQCLGRPLS